MRRSLWGVVLVVLLGGAAIAYHYWRQGQQPPPPPSAPAEAVLPPPPVAAGPAASPSPSPAPAPQPEAQSGVQPVPLPALDESDATMRQALAGLVGAKSLAEFFYPDRIIRRIVATIDNLPRARAPVGMMPVKPIPSSFVTAGTGNNAVIGPDNWARYAPYAAVVQAVDAEKAVDLYVRLYPLFQRAYEELGYPKGRFNDRLVEAIDDLLAAPDISDPIKLVQPKVLYQFADPKLEAASAGQKIMIRMGTENADKVKAKLREIRQDLMRRIPRQ